MPLSRILVGLCMVSLVGTGGCGQRPQVDIRAVVEDGAVVFEVEHQGINGLIGIKVEDNSGETLWDVNLPYSRSGRIVYGMLPNEKGQSAKQVYPKSGAPPASIRGKKVRLLVQYQYDAPHPATRTLKKEVVVP